LYSGNIVVLTVEKIIVDINSTLGKKRGDRTMRRIAFSIIAATCFIAGSAGAAITLDMIWAAPASVGGGTPTLSFVGTPDANLSGGCKKLGVGQQDGYCLQLILTIDVPWAAATSNFGWSEAGSGMANTNVADYSWGFNNPMKALALSPTGPAYRSTGECSVLGCDKVIGSVGAAAGADAGAAGTWTLGSVNFNLTGTLVGTHEIENFWRDGIDDIINTVGHLPGGAPGASGYVTVVPEPGTVSLLGLGIVGLVLAGRRRNR
jgi:hypothetical protein